MTTALVGKNVDNISKCRTGGLSSRLTSAPGRNPRAVMETYPNHSPILLSRTSPEHVQECKKQIAMVPPIAGPGTEMAETCDMEAHDPSSKGMGSPHDACGVHRDCIIELYRKAKTQLYMR